MGKVELFDVWSDDVNVDAYNIFDAFSSDRPKISSVKSETPKTIDAPVEPQHSPSINELSSDDEVGTVVTVGSQRIDIRSDIDLEEVFESLPHRSGTSGLRRVYDFEKSPRNCFALSRFIESFEVVISDQDRQTIMEIGRKSPEPTARVHNGQIVLNLPAISDYFDVVKTLGAWRRGEEFVAPLNKVFDLVELAPMEESILPAIQLDKTVTDVMVEPIPGFDGTLESLRGISLDVLTTVSKGRSIKKGKTLVESFSDFGITDLYELLFFLPRNYIDKSKPQDIRYLIPDEKATVIGTVTKVSNLPDAKGVRFGLETESGSKIDACFWRQHWLANKFPIGSEVLVTGKFSFWNRQPQLSGSSIEWSKEAAMLPIVPVYPQSEAKGVTTISVLSAVRELFSRLGEVLPPEYFTVNDDVRDLYQGLHLPDSLDDLDQKRERLAFFELVYVLLLMRDLKESASARKGLSQKASKDDLQAKAIQNIPFSLTGAQSRAVKQLNESLASDSHTSTLLSADVGSGKTLVAQLTCLRSVDAGRQAVLVGPTEILARQLHSTFVKLLSSFDNSVRIEFVGGKQKAAEKRRIAKEVADGTIDVIVGTHSVLTLDYHDLGLVCIDEQQKFGVEQRTVLLESRKDDCSPDILMQTATPVPRSIAQSFYGDVKTVILDEKPAGRLPIETEWIKENPIEFTRQMSNNVWSDIISEAAKGNQTFVITPFVEDSGTIEAASVKTTVANLESGPLSSLRIGTMHGKLKPDEASEMMRKFRDKELDVMVGSVVVEVGVDIPDATRVVILSADRLGASSLHQIRGRVGRNSKPSRCYLVSETEGSAVRLQSLVDSNDGFEIAKIDLLTRGEGKVLGSVQSGKTDFKFANLIRHSHLIQQAREEADRIFESEDCEQALSDARSAFGDQRRLV